MPHAKTILRGSRRVPVARAKRIGPTDPAQRTHVTVHIRRKEEPRHDLLRHGPLGREEYVDAHGACASDFLTLRDYAADHGLEPQRENPARRSIELHGTVGELCRAFGTTLEDVQLDGRTFRQRRGGLAVPAHLGIIVEAVLGLDNRPQAKPLCRRINGAGIAPSRLAALYECADDLDGSGQTIALIELGGQETDDRVALDVQAVAAVAPAARQVIYSAPNTEQGFLDALRTAIHADDAPSAIVIGWGSAEDSWTLQAVRAVDRAFEDAALLGIPVLVSSAGLVFPASAPYAVACGGIHGPAGKRAKRAASHVFAGRVVPDLCAIRELAAGCEIVVDGAPAVVDGAAALAPLWAALIARFDPKRGRSSASLTSWLHRLDGSAPRFPDLVNATTNRKGVLAMKTSDASEQFTQQSAPAVDGPLATFTPSFEEGSGSGSSGVMGLFEPPSVLPAATPAPAPQEAAVAPPPAVAAAPLLPSFVQGSNSVAIVGVVGLASVMGLVATAAVVATVAVSKDRS